MANKAEAQQAIIARIIEIASKDGYARDVLQLAEAHAWPVTAQPHGGSSVGAS